VTPYILAGAGSFRVVHGALAEKHQAENGRRLKVPQPHALTPIPTPMPISIPGARTRLQSSPGKVLVMPAVGRLEELMTSLESRLHHSPAYVTQQSQSQGET
jgi:hypothetical protein